MGAPMLGAGQSLVRQQNEKVAQQEGPHILQLGLRGLDKMTQFPSP